MQFYMEVVQGWCSGVEGLDGFLELSGVNIDSSVWSFGVLVVFCFRLCSPSG